MKEEYKEFIGIYDESVPVELCDGFVRNWEEAKNNRTLIDLTKENETLVHNQNLPHLKKDEVAFVAPVLSTMYPIPPVKHYFFFFF